MWHHGGGANILACEASINQHIKPLVTGTEFHLQLLLKYEQPMLAASPEHFLQYTFGLYSPMPTSWFEHQINQYIQLSVRELLAKKWIKSNKSSTKSFALFYRFFESTLIFPPTLMLPLKKTIKIFYLKYGRRKDQKSQ